MLHSSNCFTPPKTQPLTPPQFLTLSPETKGRSRPFVRQLPNPRCHESKLLRLLRGPRPPHPQHRTPRHPQPVRPPRHLQLDQAANPVQALRHPKGAQHQLPEAHGGDGRQHGDALRQVLDAGEPGQALLRDPAGGAAQGDVSSVCRGAVGSRLAGGGGARV